MTIPHIRQVSIKTPTSSDNNRSWTIVWWNFNQLKFLISTREEFRVVLTVCKNQIITIIITIIIIALQSFGYKILKKYLNYNTHLLFRICSSWIWFGLVYGISTIVGYLMPNSVFAYISNLWFVNTFFGCTQLNGQIVLFPIHQFSISQQG